MGVIERILTGLRLDGAVVDVRVGALWTAVAVETERGRRAGLASTQIAHDVEHGRPLVREAGRLTGKRARELADLALQGSDPESGPTLTERSIGFAAINALIDAGDAGDPERGVPRWVEANAEDLILERGAGRRVAVIGHFPFVPRVRELAAESWVLELNPRPGDLPAERARDVLPQADVVAITGQTLVNGTFDRLIAACRPEAFVVVLGPTTPLSPLLFDYGVDAVSGAVVSDVAAVLAAASQGANFRQMPGRRLVTLLAAER